MSFNLNSLKKNLKEAYAKNNFDVTVRLAFYEKLGTALEEDISILEAVTDLHKRYKRKKHPLQYMTESWIYTINSGQNFSKAVQGWVPESDIYLISAGEEKGNIKDSFAELIRITEEQRKLKKLVKQKIFPQFFTLMVLFGVVYGFSMFLAPEFKKLIDESEWPPIAVNYFAFSDWVVANGYIVGSTLIAFSVFAGWSFKRLTGKFRAYLDKFPPWTVYREIESANLLIVLSGMIKSGISSNDAISKIKSFSPNYIKKHLERMQKNIASGMNEGEAMDTGLLPEELRDDVIDYGKRAGFSRGILSIGRRASGDVIEKIEKYIDKLGKSVNYMIYGYAGFAIVSISELVNQLMTQF